MNISSVVVQGQVFAFPKEEYERRQVRARKNLAAAGIDALVSRVGEHLLI